MRRWTIVSSALLRAVSFALSVGLLFPAEANALLRTFVYSGSYFSEGEVEGTNGVFTTKDRVMAVFTVDCSKAHPQGDCKNLNYENYYVIGAVNPDSVLFTAGPARLPTEEGFANVVRFSFATDQEGQIVAWDLDLSWPDPIGIINVDTDLQLDSVAALGEGTTIWGRPGTWSFEDAQLVGTTSLIRLEEPVSGATHSGIGNLRGWALDKQRVERVEIYIDGKYLYDAPYGGSRRDVGSKYPEFPNANDSGFSLAYGYSNLAIGQHTITARVVNSLGDVRSATATFEVVAFDQKFISTKEEVDLTEAEFTARGREIYIRDAFVGDRLYDITLRWRPESQRFEIVEIR